MAKAKPLTRKEGLEILTRDHFRCRYCGLDGTASFENAMMMTVDFVIPRAKGGKKTGDNLVTACRVCNLLKGRGRFSSVEEAREHVMARRDERKKEWQRHMEALQTVA